MARRRKPAARTLASLATSRRRPAIKARIWFGPAGLRRSLNQCPWRRAFARAHRRRVVGSPPPGHWLRSQLRDAGPLSRRAYGSGRLGSGAHSTSAPGAGPSRVLIERGVDGSRRRVFSAPCDATHFVKSVDLADGLVRPQTDDARQAQRVARFVALAGLDLVERHLDHGSRLDPREAAVVPGGVRAEV